MHGVVAQVRAHTATDAGQHLSAGTQGLLMMPRLEQKSSSNLKLRWRAEPCEELKRDCCI